MNNMEEQPNPNILFILTDDQGPWALACAGNREIETPNLDRLAGTGMRFENFFCASPVCSPARASLLTGRIPSQHGVHDWLAAGNTVAKYEPYRRGQLIAYLEGIPAYTDFLAEAGYHCGLSGKWHLGDCHHPQKSFSYWAVHAKGGGPYYNAPMIRDGEVYEEPRYVTDVITDNALAYLESRKGKEGPFYLGVHYTAPHSPWTRRHHPVPLYDAYYNGCPFESVPNGATPPEWVQYLRNQVKDDEERRAWLSGYYTAVTAMDQNVGRLLDWLESHGLRENTLIIFTSDNGMNMGHHGVYGKGNATLPLNMFEESVRVPFIISHPGHIPAGSVNHALVSQYDFMPTLLDYLGIQNPLSGSLPGKSFAELLRGDSAAHHEHVVVFDEYGPVRMVRTREWKYVYRNLMGPDELYHLVEDPSEQHNLAGDVGFRAVEKEMKDRLENWFSLHVEPDRDGAYRMVTGSGQVDRCCQSSRDQDIFLQRGVRDIVRRARDGG